MFYHSRICGNAIIGLQLDLRRIRCRKGFIDLWLIFIIHFQILNNRHVVCQARFFNFCGCNRQRFVLFRFIFEVALEMHMFIIMIRVLWLDFRWKGLILVFITAVVFVEKGTKRFTGFRSIEC